jgi:hypothetical protein
MNNKIVGAILVAGGGIVAAVGAVIAQIANSNVLLAFYVQTITRVPPPDLAKTPPCWSVFALAAILALAGLFFLFSRGKSE